MHGVSEILSLVSDWGTFVLSWVSGVAAVASGVIAWKVYRSQSSPDVIAYVDAAHEGSVTAALFVKNIGTAPAYDVAFSVDGTVPTEERFDKEAVDSFLSKEIPMLPPGSTRGTYLGVFHVLLKGPSASSADLTVRYRDSKGRKYESVFPIEVDSFRSDLVQDQVIARKLGDVRGELSKVSKELKEIRGALEGMRTERKDGEP